MKTVTLMTVAGGGVHHALAPRALRTFVETHNVPAAETQADKSALAWDHPLDLGSIGVTGSSTAGAAAAADPIIAAGTRLQDFTTGSWSLFANPARRKANASRGARAYSTVRRASWPRSTRSIPADPRPWP